MATNSEAILWLDGLCDGAVDLTADNVGLAKQVRSMLRSPELYVGCVGSYLAAAHAAHYTVTRGSRQNRPASRRIRCRTLCKSHNELLDDLD